MKFWSAYGALVLAGLIIGFIDGYNGKPPMVSAILFSILLVATIARFSEKPL